MSSSSWFLPIRGFAFVAAAAVLTAGAANAQLASAPSTSPSSTAVAPNESSSSSYAMLADNGDAAEPAAPAPAGGSGAGQYDNNSAGGGGRHGWLGRMAYEAGGGFNGPTSSSSPYITWGGNFTVGAGMHFSHGVSLLAEYQFIDDKLPGAIIAETGATGGNAHIWSLSLDPVINLMPKRTNSVYVTGGAGFYRKVTSFTDPEPTEYCSYYYCGIAYQNAVVGHFSSNQAGYSLGAGYARKLGGMYGEGKTQLFAEARYLYINTPSVNSSPNGLGTTTVGADTRIIPVTFGVRF